jgi:outer membrane protein OmpA-like peptidoglycan-associated protein
MEQQSLKNLPKRLVACGLLGAVFALGCASTNPSPQLVDARRAYDQARMSPAGKLAPARVYTAKQALDRAERAHEDDAGSFEEKSLAYIAQRQAELAIAYGGVAAAERDKQIANQTYDQRQTQLLESAEGRAARAQNQLASQSTELARERDARASAEKRAAAAMASLAEVARVKEESRGTVITLEGSVLFASGKSELLPIAREKLDQVAKALMDASSGDTFVIEGHTDSQGSDQANQALSQARADAVRSYLVGAGVAPDKIRSVGRGESQPVASNDSPEGRANNRRVEIVVQNAAQAAQQPSPARPVR